MAMWSWTIKAFVVPPLGGSLLWACGPAEESTSIAPAGAMGSERRFDKVSLGDGVVLLGSTGSQLLGTVAVGNARTGVLVRGCAKVRVAATIPPPPGIASQGLIEASLLDNASWNNDQANLADEQVLAVPGAPAVCVSESPD